MVCLVGDVVQVATSLQVGVVQVDCGGHYTLLENLRAHHGLDATRPSKGVSDHGLDGGDLHLVRVVAEERFDGLRLGLVVQLS